MSKHQPLRIELHSAKPFLKLLNQNIHFQRCLRWLSLHCETLIYKASEGLVPESSHMETFRTKRSKGREKELKREFSVGDFVTRVLRAMSGNIFGCLDWWALLI